MISITHIFPGVLSPFLLGSTYFDTKVFDLPILTLLALLVGSLVIFSFVSTRAVRFLINMRQISF
ncbi:MAG: hypothetical protein KBD21_03860 [Candidatus Pacebacteria bacterium]|nr:hypothetical protein [Candidatus Paceibacterota bacterium]